MTTLKITLNGELYDLYIDGELIRQGITMDEALVEIASAEKEESE